MLLFAHRGASHDAPENTLAAFELAWEQDADGIEGDFRLTADGHLVCMHDPDTGRVATHRLDVATATLAQLQQLDVGAWKGKAYRFEPVPTLPAILDIVPPGRRLLVEIKDKPAAIDVLTRDLEASLLAPEQVDILAFDTKVIQRAKALLPAARAFWLSTLKDERDGGQMGAKRVLEILRACGADGLDTEACVRLTPELAAQVRHEGYGLYVWTVDTPDLALHCHRLGVQGLTTNRPGFLREKLSARLLG